MIFEEARDERSKQVQDKIIELETKYSFQEELLTELNQEMIKQQRQLQAVMTEMRALREQLEGMQTREGDPGLASAADEKPPHY
jgi:SlyX protein